MYRIFEICLSKNLTNKGTSVTFISANIVILYFYILHLQRSYYKHYTGGGKASKHSQYSECTLNYEQPAIILIGQMGELDNIIENLSDSPWLVITFIKKCEYCYLIGLTANLKVGIQVWLISVGIDELSYPLITILTINKFETFIPWIMNRYDDAWFLSVIYFMFIF